MRFILLAFLAAAACGGSSVEWAGKWKQPTGFPAGAYVECTLGGSGTTINGSGTQYREAGTPLTFTVSGTTAQVPQGGVTFTYSDSSTESFVFQQPDQNHITLTNTNRTVDLTRE